MQVVFENGDVLDGIHSDDVRTERVVIKTFPFTKESVQLLRPEKGHELIDKGFFREWNNVHGRRLEVYGVITKCWQGFVNEKDLLFTVEYVYQVGRDGIPKADNNVSEPDAWGGFIALQHKIGDTQQIPPNPPFHLNWIVPATPAAVAGTPAAIVGTLYPTLVTSVNGFELRFNVAKSSIPNAGLGLWMTCKEIARQPMQTKFVLQAGELVCIWTYGPLQVEDLKSKVVFSLKNFIHLGSPSRWSFERTSHEGGYIDVTDDWSGDLHNEANNNLVAVAFANEVNGKGEVPNVCALSDPSGAMQYLLGHRDKSHGVLEIPVNTPTELKVRQSDPALYGLLTRPVNTNFTSSSSQLDCGDSYEGVRIASGYSRGKPPGKKSSEETRAAEVKDAVENVATFSLANCGEALSFLERLFSEAWNATPEEKNKRALIAVLSLHARIEALFRVRVMAEQDMLTRVKSLVSTVCDFWQDSQSLKDSITAMDVTLKTVAANSIGWTLPILELIDSADFRLLLLKVDSTSDREGHL